MRGGTTSTFAQTMPEDAAKEASTWFVSKIELMKGKFDADFFKDNNEEGSKILDAIADGDFSSIPDGVQHAFVWTKDAQSDEQTVSFVAKEASAYTAMISAWQLRSTGLEQNSKLTIDENSITVDREHGLVYMPAEAFCGFPASLTFIIKWTGNDWKIDGDMIGNQIAAAVRNEQLVAELKAESQGSADSSGSK